MILNINVIYQKNKKIKTLSSKNFNKLIINRAKKLQDREN